MRLLIDNQDGNGLVDYTGVVASSGPLTLHSRRGEHSRCTALLDVAAGGLPAPALRAHVVVLDTANLTCFEGYLSESSTPASAAVDSEGERTVVGMTALERGFLAGTPVAAPLQPPGAAAYPVSLEENAVRFSADRQMSLPPGTGDITVSGEVGAAAYVTEFFRGDGTADSSELSEEPFREAHRAKLIDDSFNRAQLNTQTWSVLDPGQHLGLGSGGLMLQGGSGLDGQTVLRAVDRVELGGVVTAEVSDVLLAAGSDGVLLGMYSNVVSISTCIAGFRVKGTAGARAIVALVNGAETGTAFTFSDGHLYTLRLRLHSAEMVRARQSYSALANGVLQSFGGDLVDAPLDIVMEIVDQGLASSTVATVLFAGSLSSSPAWGVFAPVNSVALVGSIGRCRLGAGGSAWVVSTLSDGAVMPRREAAVDTGGDFALSGTRLRFWPGRVPAPGELVAVHYRLAERSAARVQDAVAVQQAQWFGLPGAGAWTGSAVSPAPRCVAECAAAASALLAFANAAGSGHAGECTFWNPAAAAIPKPGDAVAVPLPGGGTVSLPVVAVELVDEHAVPEVTRCQVHFAQTEANGLSFRIGTELPADLPQPVAVTAAPPVANLSQFAVTSATATTLQVDAGMAAPNGGGFEVRRSDGGFGAVPAGTPDIGLVLRSPVRSFSIPRAAFAERFFLRGYDGNTPPNYSALSSVIVTHLPLS